MTRSPGRSGVTSRSGLRAFRLGDVPIDVRERAKARLLNLIDSPTERVMLGIAAESPSDRIYWIPAGAWETQARTVTWKRAAR